MFQQNIFLTYKYRSLPEIPAGDEMLRKDHLTPQTHRVLDPVAQPSREFRGSELGLSSPVSPLGCNMGYSEPSPDPP